MAKGKRPKIAGAITHQFEGGTLPGRIGKYRIDQIIGHGTVGIVYKGHDEQIDRPLAIKSLRPEILEDVAGNAEFLARFAAEARSAGRCLHPNIVTIFDFLEQAGAPYIIMEYVDAGTLDSVIRSGVRLPIRQVCEIMAQLLFALDHANGKGVIHRDVKPANILCPSPASVKVADFGIAHMDALDLTKPGILGAMGTPNYMAPERFLGRPADARSDLFSAGVILFQLLTGAKPFVAANIPDLMQKLLNDAPPHVQTYRHDLSPDIDAVMGRALARNPGDRFQSAAEFVECLNNAIDGRPVEDVLPLDLTKLSRFSSPAPSAPGKEGLSHTMAQRLAPVTIDALERSLARLLGPMARLFVKQASQQATSIDMLLTTLMAQIKTKAEAEIFRRDAEHALRDDLGLAAAQLETVISESEVMAATDALLELIGPMARVLVARKARTAVGRDDFYRQLAAAIPDEKDRSRFLSILVS
jgi:eukaryotic-like serine/threonine-protein kinase